MDSLTYARSQRKESSHQENDVISINGQNKKWDQDVYTLENSSDLAHLGENKRSYTVTERHVKRGACVNCPGSKYKRTLPKRGQIDPCLANMMYVGAENTKKVIQDSYTYRTATAGQRPPFRPQSNRLMAWVSKAFAWSREAPKSSCCSSTAGSAATGTGSYCQGAASSSEKTEFSSARS